MAKAVTVDGCTLEVVAPGTGDITIDPDQPSADVFINGNGVYFKEIKFSVANSNGGGSIQNNDGSGSGSISATGDGVLDADGNKCVLEGDNVTITVYGTNPSSSGSVPASGSITVKVSNAGQSDVNVK